MGIQDHVVKLGDLGEAREIGKEYETLPFPAYNWAPPEVSEERGDEINEWVHRWVKRRCVGSCFH